MTREQADAWCALEGRVVELFHGMADDYGVDRHRAKAVFVVRGWVRADSISELANIFGVNLADIGLWPTERDMGEQLRDFPQGVVVEVHA